MGCVTTCPDRVGSPPASQRRVLADVHAHPLMNEWVEYCPMAVRNPTMALLVQSFANPTAISWKTSYQAGIDLICAAHFNMYDEWISMPTDPNPQAPANIIRMMDLLEERLAEPEISKYARLARCAKELEDIVSTPRTSPEFRTAVVHSIEGAYSMGGDLASLDKFAKRGLALMTVPHFFSKGIGAAANSFPYFPDGTRRWPYEGLTEFGKSIIRRMQELGIIIDVSHGAASTVQDILYEVSSPIIATHVCARTLGNHAYALYDEHIQEIGQRRGIVGVILMPYWHSNFSTHHDALQHGTLDDVVRTVIYLAKLIGPDRIGIGSDFEGYISGPKEMSCLAEIHKLRMRIRAEFSEKETDDIMAQNVIDFMLKNWTYQPDCKDTT